MRVNHKSTLNPVAVVTSLFFMWGFITVLVDSLVPRLREIFDLTYFEAGLVQFAFFLAYFIMSIPAGWLLTRVGYKNGMLIGLGTMGIGCLLFWPAAGFRVFPLFMLGYFTLASGMTVLQVAANPYIAVLGEEGQASSRLNLAQAFNSVGTWIAPMIGAQFILSDRIMGSDAIAALSSIEREEYLAVEAGAVQIPFVVLACALLLLAIVVRYVKLPKILDTENTGTYREALGNIRLIRGAVGIFLYVGAEVAIGSYLVNYFLSMDLATSILANGPASFIAELLLWKDPIGLDPKAVVGAFVALYWGGAMVGRFVGSYLTRAFPPARILAIFGLSAIVLVLVSMNTSGFVSMWSILGVGLFNSIMFPTIFSIAIAGMGSLKPQASGILCTAICGGALIPLLLGALADSAGFKYAFLVVVACYAYITFFAWQEQRRIQ